MTPDLTLAEFLEPCRNGTHRERVLGALAYLDRYRSEPRATATQIKSEMVSSRISGARKVNVADVLAKAGSLVDKDPNTSRWALTGSGRRFVDSKFGEAQDPIREASDPIRSALSNISNDVARQFVVESIVCLEAGALRASVVFLWAGAIRCLQEKAIHFGASALSSAVQRHDPKARHVGKLTDFAQVRDNVALLAFRDLGVVDKGEWSTLQEALDLRNRCSHPTQYSPKILKVRAFIEDIIGVVFT